MQYLNELGEVLRAYEIWGSRVEKSYVWDMARMCLEAGERGASEGRARGERRANERGTSEKRASEGRASERRASGERGASDREASKWRARGERKASERGASGQPRGAARPRIRPASAQVLGAGAPKVKRGLWNCSLRGKRPPGSPINTDAPLPRLSPAYIRFKTVRVDLLKQRRRHRRKAVQTIFQLFATTAAPFAVQPRSPHYQHYISHLKKLAPQTPRILGAALRTPPARTVRPTHPMHVVSSTCKPL